MKKLIITTLSICLAFYAGSQNPEGDAFSSPPDDLHFILQKEGTQQNVVEYFSESNIAFRKDTVYIVLLPPMVCARCEGIINPFILELREQYPETEVALMVFYPKTKALNSYLRKRQFIADHVLACTDDSFLDNFHFSTGDLQVGYILKMAVGSGKLITSKSTLGLTMDTDFIQWLLEVKTPQETYKASGISTDNKPENFPSLDYNQLKNNILYATSIKDLEEKPGHPLSLIEFPSFSEDIKYFSFLDGLSNSIYIYSLEESGASFMNALFPGDEEDRMFIAGDIGDTLFLFLKQMNIINSMYFSNTFIGDRVMITASLPRIFWEDKETEKIAYFNQPSYLLKDIKTGKTILHVIPETNSDTLLSFSHIESKCIEKGKYFFLPVSKGWPVSGTKSLQWDNVEVNPFRAEFYHNIPLFSVYDQKGRFIRYFDYLDSVFIQNKTGYTFSNPLVKSFDGKLWVINPNSGELRCFASHESDEPLLKIPLIENKNFSSRLDPKIQPLEYLEECSDNLQNNIVDFIIEGDHVWFVSKEGDFYRLAKQDLKDNARNEWLLPTVYEKRKANTFKIFNIDKKVVIMGIYESPDLTSIIRFDPPQ